jgi:hypothetical protein
MKNSHAFFILVVVVSLLSSTIFQNSAFAQMESLKITGNQYPEINSIFNVNVIVEGTSRASGQIFNMQYDIYQKDNSLLMDHGVQNLYSGTNRLKIDLETGLQPYKPNVNYILEVQHTYTTTTFEFVPVDKSLGVSPPTIETKPSPSTLEQLMTENQELKNQLQDKNAIIMEQIKVIQNLASMIRNAIFEPILNYFEI